MPLYEHVLIARQDLSNAQAEGLIEHFSTVVSDNGGNRSGGHGVAQQPSQDARMVDAPVRRQREEERLSLIHI